MENKNIFIRIWEVVILFLKTITGIELRDSLNELNRQTDEFRKEQQKQKDEQKKLDINMLQMLVSIKRKAYFPVLFNNRGRMINLLMEKEIKAEMIYDPVSATLNIELSADQRLFEKYDIDLEKSYEGNVNRPLMSAAKIRFEKKDRAFMDECSKNFIYGIISFSFDKEVLQHSDIMEILGKTIISVERPDYIKANNLQDFIIDKGPVEKPEEKKNYDDSQETTNEV